MPNLQWNTPSCLGLGKRLACYFLYSASLPCYFLSSPAMRELLIKSLPRSRTRGEVHKKNMLKNITNMFKSTKSAVIATERPIIGILTQSLLSTLKTDYPWASSYLAARSVLSLSTKIVGFQAWIFRFIGLEEKNPDREIGEIAFFTFFQP